MARGAPDYNVPSYSYFAVETPTSDIVAERQGFSRLDNRGRVLWFEDWRSSYNRWGQDYDTSASQVAHVANAGSSPGYHGAIKLSPLSNGGYAGMAVGMMLPVSKRLGIEYSFEMGANAGALVVQLQHNLSGTTRKSGSLNIKEITGAVYIQTDIGQTTVFTPSPILSMQVRYISMKVVIDLEAGTYVRAMIGNTEYDLSSHNLSGGAAGLTGDTYASVYVYGMTAVYKEPFHIGYVVISGDEP